MLLNKVGGNEDDRPNDGEIFLGNFVCARLFLLLIVFSLTIHPMTIKSHKKHSEGLLKQILDMQSVILLFLCVHYTIDDKKPLINRSLRYLFLRILQVFNDAGDILLHYFVRFLQIWSQM